MIKFQITAPLFSSRLFEYGPDAGDQEVPRSLDVGKKVNLVNPIRFYGDEYSTVYVSHHHYFYVTVDGHRSLFFFFGAKCTVNNS